MPFTAKPACASCSTKSSSLWRKGSGGKVYCSKCAAKEIDGEDISNDGSKSSQSSTGTPVTPYGTKTESWTMGPLLSGNRSAKDSALSQISASGPLRKSARIKPSKYKYQPVFKTLPTKGKSRRVIFKKNPIKAPSTVSTVITSDHIFNEGQYWQTGDIASVMDDDGSVYYVQLRGFLQDQYCEKSAVITWLLPTTASIPGKFDPATYIIGPEEDLPRPMSYFEFVMHAPSSYFHDKSSPYPTRQEEGPQLGYIVTSLGPEIRRVPHRDQIHGLRELDMDDMPSEVKTKVKGHDGERKRKTLKERKKNKGSRFMGKKQLEASSKLREKAAAAALKEKTVSMVTQKETRNTKAESPKVVDTKIGSDKESKGSVKDTVKTVTLAPRRGRRVKAKPKEAS